MSTPKKQLHVEMADGTEHDVTIVNADLVKYDEAAMVNNWRYPDADDPRGGLLMQTYLAWHRMQKLGLYDKPFATFKDDCVDVTQIKTEATADPTPPDHTSDK